MSFYRSTTLLCVCGFVAVLLCNYPAIASCWSYETTYLIVTKHACVYRQNTPSARLQAAALHPLDI